MSYEEHEQLLPTPPRAVLWKFMTFSHFVNLVETNTLYFRRIDKFEDVFEGTYPVANEKQRPEIYKGTGLDVNIVRYDEMQSYARQSIYACCFHRSKYETAFMWKQYADQGVAIKTTAERLMRAFKPEQRSIYISPITYIDYNTEFLPERNLFYLALHKRKSFEPEREVRAVIWDEENKSDGMKVKVNLRDLLYDVYVSPYADSSVVENTQIILKEQGMTGIKVEPSDLYTMR